MMSVKIEVAPPDNKVAVALCRCEGELEHSDFTQENYLFPDGSTESLPVLCIENELYPADLYHHFLPVLKTIESNENSAMLAYYAGLIAEVRPGLYFYAFGDVDEIGECNFYIKSDLNSVIHELLREWGPYQSNWNELLRFVGANGYPKGYEPDTIVNLSEFFPNSGEETLTLGFSYNLENKDLHKIMKELDL
jgi:hypothetical protein